VHADSGLLGSCAAARATADRICAGQRFRRIPALLCSISLALQVPVRASSSRAPANLSLGRFRFGKCNSYGPELNCEKGTSPVANNVPVLEK